VSQATAAEGETIRHGEKGCRRGLRVGKEQGQSLPRIRAIVPDSDDRHLRFRDARLDQSGPVPARALTDVDEVRGLYFLGCHQASLVAQADPQNSDAPVTKIQKVPGRGIGAAMVVNVDGRHIRIVRVQGEGHERQSTLLSNLHDELAACAAEQEPIHQRALDAPADLSSPSHGDQRQPGSPRVADPGYLGQEAARPRVAEKVLQRLGRSDPDGIDLACTKQPPLGTGPAVAHHASSLEDPLAQLLAHALRTTPDVGGRAMRDPGRLRHIPQPDGSRHVPYVCCQFRGCSFQNFEPVQIFA
jgi:hypothetical protein